MASTRHAVVGTLAVAGIGFGIAMTRRPPIGLWWDIGSRYTLADLDNYVAGLKRAKVRWVYVEVDQQTDGVFGRGWTNAGLARFAKALKRAKIRMGIMTWPWPTRAYYDSLAALAGVIRDVPQIKGVMFDIEGYNARTSDVVGFRSREEAATAIVGRTRALAGRRREVVSTMHSGYLPSEWVVTVDGVIVQAYSGDRGGSSYDWGERFGPGDLQRLAMAHAREAGARRIDIGLTFSDQDFPGREADDAMGEAMWTAEQEGAGRIFFWSARDVFGHPRANTEPWALPFLMEVATRRPIARARALKRARA